mgnify:CR=1 FL=1
MECAYTALRPDHSGSVRDHFGDEFVRLLGLARLNRTAFPAGLPDPGLQVAVTRLLVEIAVGIPKPDLRNLSVGLLVLLFPGDGTFADTLR